MTMSVASQTAPHKGGISLVLALRQPAQKFDPLIVLEVTELGNGSPKKGDHGQTWPEGLISWGRMLPYHLVLPHGSCCQLLVISPSQIKTLPKKGSDGLSQSAFSVGF